MSHSSMPPSSNETPLDEDDFSDVCVPPITEEVLRDQLNDSAAKALGLGENGGPVGFNAEGQLVERVPNDEYYVDENGEPVFEDSLPYNELVLLRSLAEINGAYRDHWAQISWLRNHHRYRGNSTDPKFREAKARFDAIAERHGGRAKLLKRDAFEWGLIKGRMEALSWALGIEWERAGDT